MVWARNYGNSGLESKGKKKGGKALGLGASKTQWEKLPACGLKLS
jgi:hypothetical protein